MKVTVDIDCTPQEARAFFGLPNVEPMQDQLMAQMQEQLSKYLANADPEVILKTWFPESLKGFGQFQEQFWRQFMDGMGGAGMTGSSEGSKGGDKKG